MPDGPNTVTNSFKDFGDLITILQFRVLGTIEGRIFTSREHYIHEEVIYI